MISFEQVRRRKIVQWALAYVAAAWALLQVLALVADSFGWPRVVTRGGILLAGLGLLATLVISWYHGERGAQRVSGVEILLLAGIFVLAGATVVRLAPGRAQDRGAAAGVGTQSKRPVARQMVVVLPFQNLGPTEDQYFVDGMTEELTTRLAGIGGLGVISRTSANQYRNTTKSVHQIGAELGVDYVVEGSVRWERTPGGAGQVRITPQLIRVSDDTHLWASSYDRELREIFAVQSDIAGHVVDALVLTLTPRERRHVEERPTENMKAYDYYLRAIDAGGNSERQVRAALALYEQAVAADSGFVRAWLGIAMDNELLTWWYFDRSPTPCQKADAAIRRAEALAGDDPSVHVARGFYYSLCFRDFDRARVEVELAGRGLPPNAGVAFLRAGILGAHDGDFEAAFAELQQAIQLDPRNAQFAFEAGDALYKLGRYQDARAYFERALALRPGWVGASTSLPFAVLNLTGVVDSARAALQGARAQDSGEEDELRWARIYFDELARDYEAALKEIVPGRVSGWDMVAPAELSRGEVYILMGRRAEARRSFEQARLFLEARRDQDPTDPRVAAALGLVYAGLDRRAEALAAAARAVELVPISKDARSGLSFVYYQARTLIALGEKEAALDRLEVLRKHRGMSPAELRLELWWDPLRGEPRFQRLAQAR